MHPRPARKHLLLFLLLLSACTAPTLSPTLAEQTELLKSTCLAACISEQSATIMLEGLLYTTEEAVCIRQGRFLSCGTCSCEERGLLPGPLVEATEPRNVTCTFRTADEGINTTCA